MLDGGKGAAHGEMTEIVGVRRFQRAKETIGEGRARFWSTEKSERERVRLGED